MDEIERDAFVRSRLCYRIAFAGSLAIAVLSPVSHHGEVQQ